MLFSGFCIHDFLGHSFDHTIFDFWTRVPCTHTQALLLFENKGRLPASGMGTRVPCKWMLKQRKMAQVQMNQHLLTSGNILVLVLLMQRKVVTSMQIAIYARGTSQHFQQQELQHITAGQILHELYQR
jgi:hypothetical protein